MKSAPTYLKALTAASPGNTHSGRSQEWFSRQHKLFVMDLNYILGEPEGIQTSNSC